MTVEGKSSPHKRDLPNLSLQPASSRALPAALARETAHLARDTNLFLGTSSWKYEGWLGQIYDEQRYIARGKLSHKRFETGCLEEYAEIFPTVCVDAGYYRFPSEKYLANLCAQVPDNFRLSFKVTDEITVKKFPKLERFGDRAGTDNRHFLDAGLFVDAFLGPLSPHRKKTGVLIFEFSAFYPAHFARLRDFIVLLDEFLGRLPANWQYGVEVRNAKLLRPEYFDVLRTHNVTHVFNSWTRMPPVEEQMAIPGAFTTDFFTARFLLRPGRAYEQAVKEFQPYAETKETNKEARAALRSLIQRSVAAPTACPSYAFVNNRLEGNSPNTIAAALDIKL
ncbi:MAG: DUF72 domain-containing protein [Chthoniobacterales bacterium]|nr:DUF72 domain-containing protein [Chthoniobacterales bacterium]